MAGVQKVERRSIYAALVARLLKAGPEEAFDLAGLINISVIPENHDEIIKAWEQKKQEFNWPNDLGVTAGLLEQKQNINITA